MDLRPGPDVADLALDQDRRIDRLEGFNEAPNRAANMLSDPIRQYTVLYVLYYKYGMSMLFCEWRLGLSE
jgi:hypothetical protein